MTISSGARKNFKKGGKLAVFAALVCIACVTQEEEKDTAELFHPASEVVRARKTKTPVPVSTAELRDSDNLPRLKLLSERLSLPRNISTSLSGKSTSGDVCFVKLDSVPVEFKTDKVQIVVSEMKAGVEVSLSFTLFSSRKGGRYTTEVTREAVGDSRIELEETEIGSSGAKKVKSVSVANLPDDEREITIQSSHNGDVTAKTCSINLKSLSQLSAEAAR